MDTTYGLWLSHNTSLSYYSRLKHLVSFVMNASLPIVSFEARNRINAMLTNHFREIEWVKVGDDPTLHHLEPNHPA